MRLKPIVTALCAGALLAASPLASAKELKAIGVTVGDLANPFFVQITKGAELEARKLELAAKQEMLQKAFDKALERLLTLPEEQ